MPPMGRGAGGPPPPPMLGKKGPGGKAPAGAGRVGGVPRKQHVFDEQWHHVKQQLTGPRVHY